MTIVCVQWYVCSKSILTFKDSNVTDITQGLNLKVYVCVCVWAPLCHFSDVRYYNFPCYQYQVTNLDDYRYNNVYCICACKCELVCMWQIRNKRPVCGHMMAGDSINNVTQPQSELWNWNIMLWRRKFISTVWSLSVCVLCVRKNEYMCVCGCARH